MAIPTEFAAAERASREEVFQQYRKLVELPLIHDFLDAIPNMSLVLNQQRQIVFANLAFREFLGLDPHEAFPAQYAVGISECPFNDVLGHRPGEAVGCIRARLTEGGCGTTRFCQTCGAVASILNSQELNKLDVQECRMILGEEGLTETSLDLRIWSRPIDVQGEQFTIFSVVDISNEKRRQVLERIFFHDVLNTAGGMKGFSDILMQEDLTLGEVKEISRMLSESAEHLMEEINAQRALSAAESGDLEISTETVHSLEVLDRIIRQFRSSDIARGKVIQMDPASEPFDLLSDPVLLRRVLINLVKNALEAIGEGGVVTLGAFAEGDKVSFTVHDDIVMPSDVQLQIFSRSFSTKGSDRGIGTYSIKLISEKYLQGKVTFVSNPAQGTRFTVCYPRVIKSTQ